MTSREDLRRLSALGGLILDHRMAVVAKSARVRAESLARLADLTAVPQPNPTTASDARVAMLYQIWADRRRADLNLTLARQTAEWLEAREKAAVALGRSRVLDRLRDAATDKRQ